MGYIRKFPGYVHSPTDLHSCHDTVPLGFEFVLANQQPNIPRSSQNIQVAVSQREAWYWRDDNLEA